MTISPDILEKLHTPEEDLQLDLSWPKPDDARKVGKGQSGPSLRVILDAKDFTEMSAIMHVFAEGFIQSLFRTGEYVSFNEAEKRIYRLCYQDESRHLGFGVMHLKYILETEPWGG